MIGVDEYNDPNLILSGAVNDALNMKEWLTDVSGGNVPPQNLFLLLSHDSRPETPPSLNATKDSIERTIFEMIRRSGGGGERLFFYFAGHGVSTTENYVLTPAICPADFDGRRPGGTTISIASIRDYFAVKPFQEQFFFFDACRNMPHRQQFRVGHFEAPDSPTPLSVQQTIIYATTPGGKAVEIPNDECGVFTDALIRGLQGEGKSKVYDAGRDRYLVNDDRLLAFVREEIERRFQTQEDKKKYKPQIENRFDVHPTIVSFPSTNFPSVELGVKTNPPNLVPIEVRVRAGIPSKTSNTHPVRFTLPQDDYGVTVSAVNHTQSRKPWPVYLYSTQEITIDMIYDPFTSKSTDMDDDLPPDSISAGFRGSSQNHTGTINVSSTDSFAPIQIADHIGNVVANGLGNVYHKGSPGLYRVRLVSPNEKYEKIIELKPKKTEYVSIESRFTDIGASSYILDDKDFQLRMLKRDLAPSGLFLFIKSELENMEKNHKFLNDLKIRFWSQSEVIPSEYYHVGPTSKNGFAEFGRVSRPGPYWLSIESENKEPLIFSVTIPKNRVALVTLTQNNDEIKSVFQYMPDSRMATSERSVRLLRKINFMQQFYAKNALDYLPDSDIIELAYRKWEDPMAGCLAGYLLLKNLEKVNNRYSLAEIGKNMSSYYSEISDSFVLDARIKEINNDIDAVKSYHKALNTGIPLFVEGLAILYNAIKRYERLNDTVFSPLVKFAFERRNIGTPWTCFSTRLEPNTLLGR